MFKQIADSIPSYSWGATASGATDPNILTGIKKLGYTSAKFGAFNFNIYYNNIANGYPCLLTAYCSNGPGGHIWFADGYSEYVLKRTKKILGIVVKTWYEYQDLIWMNWGWGKYTGNGWYDQDQWDAANGTKWNTQKEFYYDLIPQ